MKFIHLGDLHLGKKVNEFSMIEDQKYILKEIEKIIKEQEVDAVLIAGDVYDRSIPSEEAVELFDTFLTQMSSLGKKVFVISGNHDSEERLNFGSHLFSAKGIHIAGKYEGQIKCVDLSDDYGAIHIWLMPYVRASKVGFYYPEDDTSTYDAAFRTAIGKCDVNEDERNVIIAHQFVAGRSEDPELAGSESAMLSVGTVEKIGFDCFDAFDYVALGHIHGCQAVGRETCRYSGSPLKYSLNLRELSKEKTVPVITMNEKGNVLVECIPLKPFRQVRRIKGELKKLLENAVDTNDYIYATLTDEEIQFDAMARIQEVYPNTMKLDYENHRTKGVLEEDVDCESEGKSFRELVEDFYKLILGDEPSAQEWNIIEEVAKEAGVIE